MMRRPCRYFNSRPCVRGDGSWRQRKELDTLFQFTPLREGRLLRIYYEHKDSKFQFTPLREGRPVLVHHIPDVGFISIHAPA